MSAKLLSAVLFVSVACGGASPTSAPVRFTGTVRDARGLDACTFLVDGDDSHVYEPLSLPASVQKEGARIAADVTVRRDLASACMAGIIADFANVEVVR